MTITLYDEKVSIAFCGQAGVVRILEEVFILDFFLSSTSSDKCPHKDLLARVRERETWQKGRGSQKSRDRHELRNVQIPGSWGRQRMDSSLEPSGEGNSTNENFELLLSNSWNKVLLP